MINKNKQIIRRWSDEIHICRLCCIFISGCFKAAHRDARELWSIRDGQAVFRATMSYKRFAQIKASIRFDNKLRRNRQDPLAPVRDFVDSFNASLRTSYEPGPFVCVDEHLIEFHGRVTFQAVYPNKAWQVRHKSFLDHGQRKHLPCLCSLRNQTCSCCFELGGPIPK